VDFWADFTQHNAATAPLLHFFSWLHNTAFYYMDIYAILIFIVQLMDTNVPTIGYYE
jgi:hypothetical protein